MSENNQTAFLKAEIVPLSRLLLTDKNGGLYERLSIPDYQRPYVWGEEQLSLLISDVKSAYDSNRKAYRIGTVILHEHDDGTLDIVDGQQRITTLMLILKTLDPSISLSNDKLSFNSLSKANILRNIGSVAGLIGENVAGSPAFKNYLLSNCSILLLTLSGEDKLDAVFQLFDSQNGRGKELEHYNLLKAYHIDAMHADPKEEKIFCDQRWEASARYFPQPHERGDKAQSLDLLAQLLYEQLYRGRVWGRGEPAGVFSRYKLAEFMGSNLKELKHPYQLRLLPQIVSVNITEKTALWKDPCIALDQDLLNGVFFFDYVAKYQQLYRKLFLSVSDASAQQDGSAENSAGMTRFIDFYGEYCLYAGCSRRGDSYLRELYKTVVMYAIDRFGISDVVQHELHKLLYAAVYRIRLTQSSIYYETAMKYREKLGSLDLFRLVRISSDSQRCVTRLKKQLRTLGAIDLVFRKDKVEAIAKNSEAAQANPENDAIIKMNSMIRQWLS